jgi:RNA polymerase sigma factor (sigma-70 family)
MKKATPEELAFHRRLVAQDDPQAPDELASWLYFDLIRELRAREHISVPDDSIEEAVGDAILDYCENPEQFNPERGSLRGYLLMKARSDVHDMLARMRRQTRVKGPKGQEIRLVSVDELDDEEENIIDPEQDLERYVWTRELREQALKAFPDPLDRSIAELMMRRVYGSKPYIELLGAELEGLPRSEQQRQVNVRKKRISWHLRRIGEQYDA